MSDKRPINFFLPVDLHIFLKTLSARKGVPMSTILENCVEKLKQKHDKKDLTSGTTNV
jgi:hypothetical protein